MFKRCFVVLILPPFLLFWPAKTLADDFKGHKYWAFEPYGARDAALGLGSVALWDGANTAFWNPGALALVKEMNVTYHYNPFLAKEQSLEGFLDVKIQHLAFSAKAFSHFSAGLLYRLTDLDRGIITGPYSVGQDNDNRTLGLALAWEPVQGLGIGATGKLIKQTLETAVSDSSFEYEDSFFAIDLGALYQIEKKLSSSSQLTMNFGGALVNPVGGESKDIFGESQPKILKLGYALAYQLKQDMHRLAPLKLIQNLEYGRLLNLDKSSTGMSKNAVGVGFEVVGFEMISARIGYHDNYSNERSGTTLGFGVRIPMDKLTDRIPIALNYDFGRYPGFDPGRAADKFFEIHSIQLTYSF